MGYTGLPTDLLGSHVPLESSITLFFMYMILSSLYTHSRNRYTPVCSHAQSQPVGAAAEGL